MKSYFPGIKLRHDRPNVTNGFRTALPVVGLHSPLDLDLDLLSFSIKIFPPIFLSSWQLFLHFNHLFVFMVVVVVMVIVMVMIMVMAILHQHLLNMQIFLLIFKKGYVCFLLFLLLFHVVLVFSCH